MRDRITVLLLGAIFGAIVACAGIILFNGGQFRYHRVFSNSKSIDLDGGRFNYMYDNRFHSVCYIYRDIDTHQMVMSCVKTADSVHYSGDGRTS